MLLKVIFLLTRCLKPLASLASNKSSALPAGGDTEPGCSGHPSMLGGQTLNSPCKLTCQAANTPPAVVVPARCVSWSAVHRQLVCQVLSQTSNTFETSRSHSTLSVCDRQGSGTSRRWSPVGLWTRKTSSSKHWHGPETARHTDCQNKTLDHHGTFQARAVQVSEAAIRRWLPAIQGWIALKRARHPGLDTNHQQNIPR